MARFSQWKPFLILLSTYYLCNFLNFNDNIHCAFYGYINDQGRVVSKPFSLNGGQVENIEQVYELLTASEPKFSI